MPEEIVGNNEVKLTPAPVGKRLLAAIFDLIFIPILIGLVSGFLLMAVPATPRTVILVLINVAWLGLRDLTGAGPGKMMAGIKVVDAKTGEALTVAQGFIRNLLLYIPFVLVIGYIVELIVLLSSSAQTGQRLGDKMAGTKVVVAD